MPHPFVAKFDWLVLKPAWLAMMTVGVVMLMHADWLIGITVFALGFFGVGIIAASLHHDKSFSELAAGIPVLLPENAEQPEEPLDDYTSYLIAKALLRLAALVGFTVAIISLRFGVRWYFAMLLGAIASMVGPTLLMIPIAIVAWRERASRSS
jgi:hypothetical protein